MTTVRDDLLPVVDDARSIVDGMGLRRRDASVVVRTYVQDGLNSTYTDAVTSVGPRPRIRTVSMREAQADAMLNIGDLRIDKVSALAYGRDDLDPAAEEGVEAFWWITDQDGEGAGAYRVVKILPDNFQWVVWVRSMGRTVSPLQPEAP